MALLVGREGVVLQRRVRISALDKGGTWNGGGGEGMEQPTTEEGGSKGPEAEEAPVSQYANELFGAGGVGAGADMISLISGSAIAHDATISRCAVPSRG